MSNILNNTTQLEALLAKVNALPEAIDLPELTNEAVASELISGKELIDAEGNKITGIMPDNGTISSTMDGINNKSVTIPSGYTSGGTVSLDNTIDNEVTEQTDLIAQIRTVVDSLPEAGGGGISLESVTGTVKSSAPAIPGSTAAIDGTVYYINSNGEYSTTNDKGTISVMKDSILMGKSNSSTVTISGNATSIGPQLGQLKVYHITGDFTINL